MHKLKFCLLFCFILSNNIFSQTILINEVMSSNNLTIKDEDNDYSDWIEIVNFGTITVDLNNFALSDDSENIRKWIFPDISLSPNQYLIIFASNKDRYGAELHTNFKISADGEEIILTNSDEQIIDELPSTVIPADISYGRNSGNPTEWLFYADPTPGTINNNPGYIGFAESPMFSISGGLYQNAVSVELITQSGIDDIYYTTDGSDPTTSSSIYSFPLNIVKTTVVRARVFGNGLLPSKIITNSYFINENINLPVVSLSTNPANFWDDYIGIYVVGKNGIPGNCLTTPANWNQDWERTVHIEFYEQDGTQGFSLDAGVGIHGGCTRVAPQKALKIMARSEYGQNTIPYKIFNDLPYTEFPSILLRASGNDRTLTFIRDALMHSLVSKLDLETQAYRPSVVFINGAYWGIHNIREKINEDYLQYRKNIDPNNVDLLETSGYVIEGDNIHYNMMLNFIENNDLTIESNYQTVKSYMDVDNYISYIVSEIYFTNLDWFPNNTKYWRPKTENGRWRWILFDTDYGFGAWSSDAYIFNMFNYLNDETRYSSIIYKKLKLNNSFKNQFINTFLDYANTIFQPDTVINKIDKISQIISPEIARHIAKWGNFSKDGWESNLEFLKTFANLRLGYAKNHFKSEFGLSSITNIVLNVNNLNFGKIKLNSISPNSYPWTGQYFQNVPIKLEAIPNPGYEFVGWSGNIVSTESSITYNPTSDNSITASFQPVEQTEIPKIVINEINYHSSDSFDPGEWIELFNNSDQDVDLSNWIFKDDSNDHSFVIPSGTVLTASNYLVLCYDKTLFLSLFPDVQNIIGNFDFNLSNNSDQIRIFNSFGILVDSVEYDDESPWPIEPDGNGPTLELKHPDLDNSIAQNWSASSNIGGTPGLVNSSLINKSEIDVKVFLEGTYQGSDILSTSIAQLSNFPLTQPFNAEPWNYIGLEQIDKVPNENIVDWILIELRSETDTSSTAEVRAGFLIEDGSIVDLDGKSKLSFYGILPNDYYIILHHRNHLSVMSKDKLSID